jgi:hypothetical protein
MYLIRKSVIVQRVCFIRQVAGVTNSLNLMTLAFREAIRICELNT